MTGSLPTCSDECRPARPAGLAVICAWQIAIACTARFGGRLAALPSSRSRLPRGAAALGALASRDSITRPSECRARARLPVLRAATIAGNLAGDCARGRLRPTWFFAAGPCRFPRRVTLGWSVADAPRALAAPGIAGVSSRMHAVERDGQALIEDHSTYGTFVNDERGARRVALRVGDRVRLGTPA